MWCFLRFSLFWPFFIRKTPVFTSAMPITNGRWIYEAFEQIMTLSSIREYVPSSIRKCTSIHTHSLYTNHQTKQKNQDSNQTNMKKKREALLWSILLIFSSRFFSCSIPQWIKLRPSTERIYRHYYSLLNWFKLLWTGLSLIWL